MTKCLFCDNEGSVGEYCIWTCDSCLPISSEKNIVDLISEKARREERERIIKIIKDIEINISNAGFRDEDQETEIKENILKELSQDGD